jgi:hypothetical protein
MKTSKILYTICALYLMVNAGIEMLQTGFNVDKLLVILAYSSGISWCYTTQRNDDK